MSEEVGEGSKNKPAVKLPGTVEKIIPPVVPKEPEKAQISVEGADELYKEIRVENTLQDESGQPVKLKQGASVEVTIEADPQGTTPKAHSDSEANHPPKGKQAAG